MKQSSKLIFILLLLSLSIIAPAKSDTTDQDNEFNLFLLSILVIFVCAMIGAAIIGAFGATLLLFLIFGLISIGVLSTSIAIGLYKRFLSAGFKSFLIIMFGSACMAIGGIGLLIADYVFNLPLSHLMSFFVGGLAGFVAGLLMAVSTYHIAQWSVKTIVQKLRLI